LRDLALGLLGRHQGANAAVALAAVGQLQQSGWEVPERALRSGLAGLTWPARVELVGRRPTVLLDGAHNAASAEALVRTIQESFSARRRWLIFAATREKDVRGMLACLLPQFDDAILTQYLNNPRALPGQEAAAAARELTGRSYRVCAGPAEAWSEVRGRAGPEDLVCVTGSFFVAAQIRREIRARPFPPPSRSREES
jgi:dihydrofolate synthase/folylpolyglutamate synthase